jgi:hypothetical protein
LREIYKWVAANPEAVAGGWVAIDDMDLLGAHAVGGHSASANSVAEDFESHFVRTDGTVGLTLTDKNDAIEALGGVDLNAADLGPVTLAKD